MLACAAGVPTASGAAITAETAATLVNCVRRMVISSGGSLLVVVLFRVVLMGWGSSTVLLFRGALRGVALRGVAREPPASGAVLPSG
ncbi:hypothetical protein GCM10009780_29520 [Actinomadura alba]